MCPVPPSLRRSHGRRCSLGCLHCRAHCSVAWCVVWCGAVMLGRRAGSKWRPRRSKVKGRPAPPPDATALDLCCHAVQACCMCVSLVGRHCTGWQCTARPRVADYLCRYAWAWRWTSLLHSFSIRDQEMVVGGEGHGPSARIPCLRLKRPWLPLSCCASRSPMHFGPRCLARLWAKGPQGPRPRQT